MDRIVAGFGVLIIIFSIYVGIIRNYMVYEQRNSLTWLGGFTNEKFRALNYYSYNKMLWQLSKCNWTWEEVLENYRQTNL